jgi:superfamily II DNA or RNA helicase
MERFGIYEQLITQLLSSKISQLNRDALFIKESKIEKEEAAYFLSQYLLKIISFALSMIVGENSIEKQIELSNKIILLLKNELNENEFEDDLIDARGRILNAIFSKIDANIVNFNSYVKEITPYTRLTQSELFTGSNVGISLESEIKKEIRSSNRIYLLVSFIKWSGIRIFEKELKEFTEKGNQLKLITTSYMGATDLKAVQFLAGLPNTEVKVSYNTNSERLHAKAYIFFRDTGFHTGYIGSSNISKSALSSGLEWNLKVTTGEIPHIIAKFEKTFETYWEDKEFEYFSVEDSQKLRKALSQENIQNREAFSNFFDIKPFHFQEEILEKLTAQREVHNRYRNLLVAATGTGKTVISAFDYKRYRSNHHSAKLLFVAHRKEILQQARDTFRGILRDNNFGEMWVDGMVPDSYEYLFASVQTLNANLELLSLTKSYYDFIVIDEVHHIAANSYRPILEKFSPNILLGLTATPERMDGEDILKDYCDVIAAEIRLPEALNRKLLSPFQYFSISDSVDLRSISWRNGKYSPSELTELYTANNQRVGEIVVACENYLLDLELVRALCFCVTKEHAKFMHEQFSKVGLKSDYLVSGANRSDREAIRLKLQKREINFLFVVDIFNEGVDIPEIDTVLFLRPTESLTVFLQQLGRGLRLSDEKECLTVLDFVGNSRDEYDYESKFRALIGKTNSSVKDEIENEFPHLPLGCSIVLEKKAKEIILNNIRKATIINKNQLINKIRNYKHHTDLPLTLKNFTNLYNISLEMVYKRGSWKRLCQLAGEIENFDNIYEKEIVRAIGKKWLTSHSLSYYAFILDLAKEHFLVSDNTDNEKEKLLLTMLYYDIWQDAGRFETLTKSIQEIGRNTILVEEMIEVLEILIDQTDYLEHDISLDFPQPLKVHSRYTKDQILAAFGENSFERRSSSREGVLNIPRLNTELLFVTLEKTEERFSPTTMYEDYAISENLFHWQTQNSATPERGKGLSYIRQQENHKNILLFVRERNKNSIGNTISYVFLGKVFYQSHYGSKPMSITWKLEQDIPSFLWKEMAKMAVG